MPFGRLFGRKKKDPRQGEPPVRDYVLHTMAVGYLVDYDMETWQVADYHVFDYEGGFSTEEWTIKASDDEVRFLERSVEDTKNFWTLTQTITFGAIEEDVLSVLLSDDEELTEFHIEGERFVLTESGTGRQRAAGEGAGNHFVAWTFEGPEGKVVFISQWGDRDFNVVGGYYVEEWQFTNILPGRLTDKES